MNPLLALALLVAVTGLVLFGLVRISSAVLAPPSLRPIWQGEHAVIRARGRVKAFLSAGPLFFAWVAWMAFSHPSPRGHLAGWGILLFGAAAVAFAGYGAARSFIEFQVDAVGLTRIGLAGRTAIAWTEVRAIELTSGRWVRSPSFMWFIVHGANVSIDIPLMTAGIAAFGAFALERLQPQVVDALTEEARTLLRDLAANTAEPTA